MPSLDKMFLRQLLRHLFWSAVDSYWREIKLWGEFWEDPDQEESIIDLKTKI